MLKRQGSRKAEQQKIRKAKKNHKAEKQNSKKS